MQAVAAASSLPLMSRGATNVVGHVPLNAEQAADEVSVTPGYFATIGLRLVRGREFTDQDTAGTRAWPSSEVAGPSALRRQEPHRRRIGLQHVAIDTIVVGVARDTKASLRQPPGPPCSAPWLSTPAPGWPSSSARRAAGRSTCGPCGLW